MTKNITLEEALEVVKNALRDDEDFYWSWQCNIAQKFYDQTMLKLNASDQDRAHDTITKISNSAAISFLNNFCAVNSNDSESLE